MSTGSLAAPLMLAGEGGEKWEVSRFGSVCGRTMLWIIFVYFSPSRLEIIRQIKKQKQKRKELKNLFVRFCCSGSWVCFGIAVTILSSFFFIDSKQFQTIGTSQQNRGGAHPSVNLFLFVCLFFFCLAFFSLWLYYSECLVATGYPGIRRTPY